MDEPQKKRRRGCLFYGCLTSSIIMLFVLVGVLAGLHHLRKMLNQVTDSQAVTFPATEYTPAQLKALDQRLETFQAALDGKVTPAPLSLSADDLNALVATKPTTQGLRGKLHVAIEGDHLKTEVSFPLSEMGIPFLKGRYLNGTASLGIVLQDGQLGLNAQNLTSKGKPIPAIYEEKIRQQNLAETFAKDPNLAATLAKIQSIEITNGKVLIVPKGPAQAEVTPAPPGK